MLGVVENVKHSLKSRRYLIPFLSYYYFRFIGRHCYFRLSTDIGDGTIETAVPKNRGVAVEISFLSGRGVKLEGWQICLPAVRVIEIIAIVVTP